MAQETAMKPTLDVIIVNWNSGPSLERCLISLAAAGKRSLQLQRVVVVDNASSDGSLQFKHPEDLPLRIMQNPSNRGFAAACNQGAHGSLADYLLFLNPDTILFQDSLALPVDFLEREENAKMGICGGRALDAAGRTSICCARFPSLRIFFGKMSGLSLLFPQWFPPHQLTPEERRHSGPVDQVIGAFFLVRRTLFETLNGFDERFFVYFEEVDLSYRARQKGYSSYFLAQCLYYHALDRCVSQTEAHRLCYSLESRFKYGLAALRTHADLGTGFAASLWPCCLRTSTNCGNTQRLRTANRSFGARERVSFFSKQ
jgi:N-acetylglucosaminyl-diphospho-decaprenol L-rhamnosyltransferase